MKEVKSLSVRDKKDVSLKVRGQSYAPQAIIAAVLTLVFFFLELLVSGKYPFGKYTFIVCDLEAQYAPFLFLYKRHLLGLDWSHFFSSFTYSFGLGAGKNMMGTFGYYLSSPLNFLVFFYKETQVNEFIMTLVAIKMALSASFMTLFIHERSTDKKSKWPILFGIMYAFSSYIMVFMFQIMWLDGYALLPLLLYSIEKFMKDKKVTRIIPVLIILFLSNYYIAYMVGGFSFFYLIVRMIVEGKFSNRKEAKTILAKFISAAAFCALTLCIILIPVGIDTLANGDPTSTTSETVKLVHYSAVDLLDQFFLGYPGEYGDVLPANLPLIFVSLMVTFLCVIYFVSDVFKGKERKAHGICLALVYLSISVILIDKAWQVFDDPNWFQHRESFVFMPLFMVIAYKVFEKIKDVTNRDIGKALVVTYAMLFVAQSFGLMQKRDAVFLFNLFFLGALALIFIGMKRTKWPKQIENMNKILDIILCIMIAFEVVAMAPILSAGVSNMSAYYGEAEDYNSQLQNRVDFMDSDFGKDNGFRSANGTIGVGLKDEYISGCYYSGNREITFFNSNSNKKFHRFMKQFGFDTNYNYFAVGYSFEAPDTDAFLSIGRAVLPTDYSYGERLAEDNFGNNLTLYGNNRVLPLAFAVDRQAFDYDFYSLEKANKEKNYFSFRDAWYKSMFSEEFTEDMYFAPSSEPEYEVVNAQLIDISDYTSSDTSNEASSSAVDSDSKSFDPDKLGVETIEKNPNVSEFYRINKKLPIIIDYTVVIESEEELYIDLSAARIIDACSVYVNGDFVNSWCAGSFYSQVIRLGTYEVGDEIHVTITSDTDMFSILDVNFAYFNYDAFAKGFDKIDTSTVVTKSADDGYILLESNITDDSMILTSIPYEDGWTLYVDGQKKDITVYENALIGIDAGSGHHDIRLEFVAPGTKMGAICSIIGVIGLVAIVILDKKQIKVTKS